MTENVVISCIIEIAGKPQKIVDDALIKVRDKLQSEKELFKCLDVEIEETELDEESTLYSGFIDARIRFKEVKHILDFIMDYTPTSIEVEEPSKITFQSSELTGILNDMTTKLLAVSGEIRQLRASVHYLNEQLNPSKK